MAAKRYQLTTEAKASSKIQAGNFRFRVSYQKTVGDNDVYVHHKNTSIIVMGQNDILSTENTHAQQMMDAFHIPDRTTRAGSSDNPTGTSMVFEDVTGSTTEGDVDINLDTMYFV